MISVLVAVVTIAAPDLKLEMRDGLDGEWQAVSASTAGMVLPEQLLSGIRFTFKEGTVTAVIGINNNQESPEKTQTGTYKIDALKQPAEIDLTPADGPEKDKTTRGIFKLKGEELTLCMSQAGLARPGKFESSDVGTVVFVFKRVKK